MNTVTGWTFVYPKRNREKLSPSLGQIALCMVGSKPYGSDGLHTTSLGMTFPEKARSTSAVRLSGLQYLE